MSELLAGTVYVYKPFWVGGPLVSGDPKRPLLSGAGPDLPRWFEIRYKFDSWPCDLCLTVKFDLFALVVFRLLLYISCCLLVSRLTRTCIA